MAKSVASKGRTVVPTQKDAVKRLRRKVASVIGALRRSTVEIERALAR